MGYGPKLAAPRARVVYDIHQDVRCNDPARGPHVRSGVSRELSQLQR